MKQLLSLVFLLSCLSSFAQEPVYTPMRLNYQFRGIKTDSLFLVPSYTDTTQANGYTVKNIGGALIRTGSDFWMRNGTATAWLQNVNVGPGASPTVQFVDSVWRVAGKDSIFWRKGGNTNKIKDSIGIGSAGLQEVTDNGDTTTNNIVLKETDTIGYISSMKLSIEDTFGLFIKPVDQVLHLINPQSIKLYANNTDTYNVLEFVSDGQTFSITNGNGETTIDESSTLYISADDYLSLGSDNITLSSKRMEIVGTGVGASDTFALYSFPKVHIEAMDTLRFIGGATELKSLSDYVNIESATNVKINADTITTNGQIKFQAADGTVIKAGDFTDNTKVGDVLYNYAKSDVDLTGSNFQAEIPGVYTIIDANATYYFNLPNSNDFPGQSIIIINTDSTDDANIGGGGGDRFDRGTGANISLLDSTKMAIFYSDGANWYGFKL